MNNERKTSTEADDRNRQTTGRKQGDADRDDPLGGEHSPKTEELGTNSLADKKPKSDGKSA